MVAVLRDTRSRATVAADRSLSSSLFFDHRLEWFTRRRIGWQFYDRNNKFANSLLRVETSDDSRKNLVESERTLRHRFQSNFTFTFLAMIFHGAAIKYYELVCFVIYCDFYNCFFSNFPTNIAEYMDISFRISDERISTFSHLRMQLDRKKRRATITTITC